MADPHRERGTAARAEDGSASVRLGSVRPPRPANDNVFPWLKQAPRLAPLLAALALLAWALIHAFDVR